MTTLKHGIIVHGGVASRGSGWEQEARDGCRAAAEVGMDALRQGKGALEASILAVTVMEDSGTYNAGSGAVMRLDGSIEMDAAVMDSTGTLGAVAAVSRVRNPVLLARKVVETPHVFLVGPGADALAERLGLPGHPGASQRAVLRHQRLLRAIQERRLSEVSPRWRQADLEHLWNFDQDLASLLTALREPGDTVGAATVDANGTFAVATSTGGSSPMLRGRVGDTPLVGSGFYAGERGAVAATGIGEEIIRRVASLRLYQELVLGAGLQEACQQIVDLFPRDMTAGFIAIGRDGPAAACNGEMPWHALCE